MLPRHLAGMLPGHLPLEVYEAKATSLDPGPAGGVTFWVQLGNPPESCCSPLSLPHP